jgi:hypothetical protein
VFNRNRTTQAYKARAFIKEVYKAFDKNIEAALILQR